MNKEKENLLCKYKKVWDKVDKISKETNQIIKTSAYGQMPPCFHEATDKQMVIIEKEARPVWEELKGFMKSDSQTYWQFTNWMKGTLPPHWKELNEIPLTKWSDAEMEKQE